MNAFVVDGSEKNFADVIIENAGKRKSCIVASYGFGVKQVERIVEHFGSVVLVADESHSQLNPRAFNRIVEMSETIESFSFIPTKIHAKIAIINGDTVIFTSANLSANRRVEVYLIGKTKSISGMSGVLEGLKSPDELLNENKGSSRGEIDWSLI